MAYLMELNGTESTPVIDEAGFRFLIGPLSLISDWLMGENLSKESQFQLYSYSIDHFHVPKFDSNGFCWMNKNQRDLYWRKDDEKSDKNAISRELVCNFDGQGFYFVPTVRLTGQANRSESPSRLIFSFFGGSKHWSKS